MTTKEISRFDLEWMFNAIKETQQELRETNKKLDDAFYQRDDETFNPYSHIGALGAQLIITEVRLKSILKVVQGE